MHDRLYRSRNDRILAGVAAGVADALDADPSLVRVVWALLVVFTGGVALLVYVVMAIVVPEAPPGWEPGGYTASPAPGAAAGGTAPSPETTSASTSDRDARRAARRARREAGGDGRGTFLAGVVLIIIGAVFLLRQVLPRIDWDLWWPVGAIAVGVLLLVFAVFPNRRSE